MSIKVIISGGGTGGHVYPAIAIAKAVKEKEPTADILFVGAQDKLEMEKVPKAGFPIKGLWISGFHRKLTMRNLMFPFKLIHSLLKSRAIIRRFKPDVAVGVGGFASGPLLEMASRAGVPSMIQEQNSYAGVTNKLLAKKVQKICVAYPEMGRFFPKEKLILTGNPVRKDILNPDAKKTEAKAHFSLPADAKT
ncbi:MAG: glycosyltransferase, partial [Bacteroidota bacterium]